MKAEINFLPLANEDGTARWLCPGCLAEWILARNGVWMRTHWAIKAQHACECASLPERESLHAHASVLRALGARAISPIGSQDPKSPVMSAVNGDRGLPTDSASRKSLPIYSGVIRYFPDALAAVAEVSRIGNEQHHPGEPLHWDRSKSTDELDALTRHLVEAGTLDTDGVRHSAKVAWRALANLQKEIEASRVQP